MLLLRQLNVCPEEAAQRHWSHQLTVAVHKLLSRSQTEADRFSYSNLSNEWTQDWEAALQPQTRRPPDVQQLFITRLKNDGTGNVRKTQNTEQQPRFMGSGITSAMLQKAPEHSDHSFICFYFPHWVHIFTSFAFCSLSDTESVLSFLFCFVPFVNTLERRWCAMSHRARAEWSTAETH